MEKWQLWATERRGVADVVLARVLASRLDDELVRRIVICRYGAECLQIEPCPVSVIAKQPMRAPATVSDAIPDVLVPHSRLTERAAHDR